MPYRIRLDKCFQISVIASVMPGRSLEWTRFGGFVTPLRKLRQKDSLIYFTNGILNITNYGNGVKLPKWPAVNNSTDRLGIYILAAGCLVQQVVSWCCGVDKWMAWISFLHMKL